MCSRWSSGSSPEPERARRRPPPRSSRRCARAQSRASYVPGELLVRFRSGTTASERSASLAVEGARPAGGLGVPGLALVKIPAGASVDTVGAELEQDPSVIYAEPNYVRRYSVVPNDPMFDQLYALSQPSDSDIDAPEAWDTTTGSSGVVVAVIDSGVSYRHPDLDGNIWTNDDPPGGGDDDGNGFVDDIHGWDFVQDDATPLDLVGHGTHVAGTIGAEGNNGTGVVGVNWDVSIMPVRAGGLRRPVRLEHRQVDWLRLRERRGRRERKLWRP